MTGGGGTDYGARNYEAGYKAYQPGVPAPEDTGHPEWEYLRAGWDAAGKEYEQRQMLQNFLRPHSTPSPHSTPRPHSTPAGPTYEEQMADAARIEGENKRDAGYSSYMDAAATATEYINQQIASEQSRANLLGVTYKMDDAMKQTRIQDYFNTIWGTSDQGELEALMKEWGDPAGFEGWLFGSDEQEAEGAEKGSAKKGSTLTAGAGAGGGTLVDQQGLYSTRPARPRGLTENVSVLGGQQTLLGG